MEELLKCFISCDLGRLTVLLQETGINGEIPGTEGFTPLHLVAGIDTLNTKESVMSFLFENGADPNKRSDENLTPVHIAAMWNRCYQLEKLLQHGGDPFLTDNENRNCFDVAADNYCYEAHQLLHNYLHEGKLVLKSKRKESKKLKFVNPSPFNTLCCHENSITDNLNNSPNLTFMTAKESCELNFVSPAVYSTPRNFENYLAMAEKESKFIIPSPFNIAQELGNSKTANLNNSLNFTFMTAKESKLSSPATLNTPKNFEIAKTENVNNSMNFTFMSAKENFPLIFSSNDESEDYSSDLSAFLKKISLPKCKEQTKVEKNGLNVTKEAECENEGNINILKEEKSEAACKKNLNKAYIFSSGSDTSDTATSDLNESIESSYDTIIDTNDTSGIVLIEMKNNYNNSHSSNSSVCTVPNDWKSYHNVISDCPTLSYCSTHSKSSLILPDDMQNYSNSKIFQELKNIGDNPGPVLDHTRHVYLHRLAKLMSGCAVSCQLPKPKYCPEIYLFLENKLDMDRARYLEKNIEEEFDAECSREWREGNQRCCFNYFLLDPRVTQNLPQRASELTTEQIFLTFLDAIFYVGKGTRGRPYSHLFEAVKSLEEPRPKSEKVNHILDIWDTGLGVISLHCFHNSIPVEAYTREACIIEASGLDNLTNIKKGDFYGLCAKLTSSRKRLIGISLLHKALQMFLLEGERFIKPKDIKKKITL